MRERVETYRRRKKREREKDRESDREKKSKDQMVSWRNKKGEKRKAPRGPRKKLHRDNYSKIRKIV